ncbi:archaellin/type IV pilin N-terminal domain-containing protein [Halorubrum aethiopicum]|uniref:archaellin/type IV pilin N-terminal domain-containing protein n=1 Tax=Halorubrum aethiopicum TaxID=1758255 RepID=UPI000AF9FB4A|nr:archaellin/type IV pilin N-terminal domain-containing protein [Halorubrum aethiopicum]
MFEFITNPEERGQVGIGTLIVFIAMVLVAAIAAGVLINTAGFLQSQAEATGQESTDLVSERIDVTSEVGIVGSEANGELSEIRLSVSGAPGADQIDLTETTIQAVGPGGQENLVFTSSASNANEVTQLSVPAISTGDSTTSVTINYDNIDGLASGDSDQDLVVEYDAGGDGSVEDTTTVTGTALDGQTITFDSSGTGDSEINTGGSLADGDEFTFDLQDTSDSTVLEESPVTAVVGGSLAESTTLDGGNSVANLGPNEFAVGSDGSFESSPVLDDQNDYTILINPDAGALENDDDSPFGEGQSATLDIVSPAGATTSVELRAPDLFNTNGEAVRL